MRSTDTFFEHCFILSSQKCMNLNLLKSLKLILNSKSVSYVRYYLTYEIDLDLLKALYAK